MIMNEIEMRIFDNDSCELFRPEQAADFLNIGLPTLRNWVNQFEIPAIVIKGRVRYRRRDLLRLIEVHTVRRGAANV